MKLSTYQAFLDAHSERLAELKRRKTFVVDSLTSGTRTLLADADDASAADLFVAEDDDDDDVIKKAAAMEALITSDYLVRYPTPVLVDFRKAVSLYLSSTGDEEDKKIKTALAMSRVNFMGTDGIRGKIVLNHQEDDFLAALLKNNAFTPDLVTVTSYAFATLLLHNDIVQIGDTVVLGNDGRDKSTDWKLNSAVKDGFIRAGLNAIDTGVVPTAIVPWKMLQLGHRGGACLTASHNPSNQNGIKFFIDGKKLLPEGRPVGDFALSALMFNYCRVEEMPTSPAPSSSGATIGSCANLDVEDDAVQWMLDILPDNMDEILADTILVYDSANGATDAIGRKVLNALHATYTTKNEVPTGDNINRQCGVAEIEGIDLFNGTEYDACIPFVREIFDKGRVNKAGKEVFGITLDGDGDRGFLLYYDITNDVVHVLDGDKCGYILAEYMIKKRGVNPSENWFLSTIESDLMTATAAETNLGLQTKVVSVGDKWIGNFTEGNNVLVGLEISGHVIFPIPVVEAKNGGTTQTLLSGVGLLTGLMTLASIQTLELTEDRIVQPFEPGFSSTYYVYFVDKARHYRGSDLWNKDIALTEEATKRLVEAGDLPSDTALVYEDKEDLNVLYINVVSGENKVLLGCIFMRNSGTEDKNATYVKGQRRYETALCSIGRRIQQLHLKEMKNGTRIECTYERFLMKTVADAGGTSTVDEVLEQIRAEDVDVSETDLFGVVHAMKKEGRITVEGRTLKSK